MPSEHRPRSVSTCHAVTSRLSVSSQFSLLAQLWQETTAYQISLLLMSPNTRTIIPQLCAQCRQRASVTAGAPLGTLTYPLDPA